MGGPGQGEGGVAPEKKTDTNTDKSKLPGKFGKGVWVGAYSMKGDPPQGQAGAEYADVQRAYAEEAMDSLSKQKIPAARRDLVKEYFDAIRIGPRPKDKSKD
jgi:hypothetical protein